MIFVGNMKSLRYLFVFLIITITASGCAKKGLLTDKYPPDFYRAPKLLTGTSFENNPKFILYGDSRPGWRLQEKFSNRNNWATWKMAIIPFYHIYWLGNGAVGGINRMRDVPDFGTKERLMVRDAIYQEAKSSNVDFIFHGGDMPTNGQRPSHWAQFIQENKIDLPLMSEFPMLPVIGNHERANDPEYGLPNYEAVFDYPQFYVLDSPDAAIFVLDSNVVVDQYEFIDDDIQEEWYRKWFISDIAEKPAWLERELKSRNQRFKIVAMHHPPISFAKHHKDWYKDNWGRDLVQKRNQLLSMLNENGVQIILCGHDHLYEHSIIRFPNSANPEMHVIISGGGGVPLRPTTKPDKLEQYHADYAAEGLDVTLAKQESVFNYCLVDIASDKTTIRVMEIANDLGKAPKFLEEIAVGDAAIQ